MRCTSCESRLAYYLERTLSPRSMLNVARHLRACPACRSLLAEAHVVDALLLTTRERELAPNFTFAVMAQVRSLPAPRPRPRIAWPMLGLYLAGAWLLLTIWLLHGGAGAFADLRLVAAPLVHAWSALSGTLRGFGIVAPLAAIGGAAILTLDAAALVALLFCYRTLRPRLRARILDSEAP